MTRRLSADVVVAAPPERVFAAATDWPGQREWIFATTTTAVRGDGHARGDRISARTGVGPLGFTDPMTITSWDPPRSCEVTHTGRVVRGSAVFAVASEGAARSRFTWSEQVEVPFGRLGGVVFAAARPLLEFFLRLSLRRFARWAVTR